MKLEDYEDKVDDMKVAIALTVFGIETNKLHIIRIIIWFVAIALTVFGIETMNMKSPIKTTTKVLQ